MKEIYLVEKLLGNDIIIQLSRYIKVIILKVLFPVFKIVIYFHIIKLR